MTVLPKTFICFFLSFTDHFVICFNVFFRDLRFILSNLLQFLMPTFLMIVINR